MNANHANITAMVCPTCSGWTAAMVIDEFTGDHERASHARTICYHKRRGRTPRTVDRATFKTMPPCRCLRSNP